MQLPDADVVQLQTMAVRHPLRAPVRRQGRPEQVAERAHPAQRLELASDPQVQQAEEEAGALRP